MLDFVFTFFRVAFSQPMISYDDGANFFILSFVLKRSIKAGARISGEFTGWRLTEKPRNNRLDNLASTFTVAFRFHLFARCIIF